MPHKPGFKLFAVWDKIIALFFAATLVVLNVLRIVNISITCDENGYGWNGRLDSYRELWEDKFGSANNHILHSLLRKFFVDNFGNTLFTLRLDSLLAQVSFLIFSYLICRLIFKNRWWQLGGYIVLNLVSPLIFEFWGLSRGYGLALSFMTLSIFFLLKYSTDKKAAFLSWSFFCAILSVYSNFGYINYYVTLCIVVLLLFLLFPDNKQKVRFVQELLIVLVSSGVLALLIVGPLQYVYHNGELAFMGNAGFLQDTVRSLVTWGLALPGPAREKEVNVIVLSVVALTFFFGVFWCYVYLKKYRHKSAADQRIVYGVTFFALLILPVILLIGQHLLFNINYLTDRAALFFIILFTLNISYILYHISSMAKVPAVAAFLSIFLLTGYNYCSWANINTTILWYFNAGDLAVLRRMSNATKGRNEKLKVGISWYSETAFIYDIKYYFPDKFYPAVVISHLPKVDSSFDYFYVDLEDLQKVPGCYERDTSCIGGGYVLLKRIANLPAATK